MTGLTGRQAAFVDAYLGEAKYNASKAARLAGYSERTAGDQSGDILRNPRVQAAINARKAIKSGANPLTTDAVLADLQWALDTARAKHDLVAFLRAIELRGKYLAMWTDKSQVEDVNETKRLDAKREEEARHIASVRLHMRLHMVA